MKRHSDWPARLTAYLLRAEQFQFSWRKVSCVHFGAGWIREATGRDVLKGLGLRHSTKAGAARALKRLGFDTLPDAVTAILGQPLANPRLAQRGDIVATGEAGAFAIGICAGERFAFLAPQKGTHYLTIDKITTAWRV